MSDDLTCVSLYSGAGGMDLGFAQAGIQPIWANDIDPAAVATYNANIPGGHAVAGDIRDPRIGLPSEGAADVVIGGPPCQGFSVAGHMNINDPRSKHVWDFLGAVARIKPRALVMENVKALAAHRRWSRLLGQIRTEASSLGYRVELFVLDASHFGVPQARQRMFLIGVDSSATPVKIGTTTRCDPITVRAALTELPRFGETGNDTRCTAAVVPAKKPVLRRSPYAGMLFNGQGRPINPDAPAMTLPATMGGNRTPIIDQHHLEHGGESWVVSYHRRLMAGEAPADDAPDDLRRLTIAEAAALQTFPLGTAWQGPQSTVFRQIGNAVPPRLAAHVARAVRAALLGQVIEFPRHATEALVEPQPFEPRMAGVA